MDLTASDEIRSFFKNYLSITHIGETIVPLRFTRPQLDVYAESEPHKIRSLSPAGICIDCETDSPFMEITFSSEAGSRQWLYFDLLVNGMLVSHTGWDECPSGIQTVRLEVPEYLRGQHRLTVYLPHNRNVNIHSIEVADGSETIPLPLHKKYLLCLGDSITQGMDALYPYNTYPVQVSRMLGMELLNQGVGGYVFNEASLDEEIDFKPDLVTVAYGTNDWNRYSSISEFRTMCEEYMNRLSFIFHTCPILVLTPLWRSDIEEEKPMGSFELLTDTIYEVCSDMEHVTVINGISLTPHIPEYYKDLSVHPNDIGFLHYGINLVNAIHANAEV
ncbi:SGNH/GDSL hydrolase family protein [Planctomycetota bacterium]